MKKFLFFFLSLIAMNTLLAQNDPAMMKAWTDYMTPGDMHKWMAKSNGTWNGDVKTYMDPDKPMMSKTTANFKMIFNGLYQVSEFKGTMMGKPFEGQGLLAYDNAKQEFVDTWVDNMGSGVVVMRGEYDPATKTLHLNGTQTDPMTKKDTTIRQDILFVDNNTQTLTLYGPDPTGKEMKMMEIKLTKAK